MSQLNIKFSTKANTASLPRSLCHGWEDTALEDARALTDFLQISIENLHAGGFVPTPQAMQGMSLAFDLLADKLRIASGELEWPLADRQSENVLRVVGPSVNAGGKDGK